MRINWLRNAAAHIICGLPRIDYGLDLSSRRTCADCAALERVAIVNQIRNTLAIERRSDAALRDLELCLEPMLASQADSRACRERFVLATPKQT
jgi:hypothetical protein